MYVQNVSKKYSTLVVNCDVCTWKWKGINNCTVYIITIIKANYNFKLQHRNEHTKVLQHISLKLDLLQHL